ncbi:hypothetical protein B0J11DRAFT_604410 [Dendryphion nanum]|uniref:Uncharacterized protein n=1 Tax=Dendryphion nanum TaxID=256645 RepID=A0A9P9DWS9_9PLEO|nr:hypothetical protein B0J11DRAFT_604410 [Dendryphion nanum]
MNPDPSTDYPRISDLILSDGAQIDIAARILRDRSSLSINAIHIWCWKSVGRVLPDFDYLEQLHDLVQAGLRGLKSIYLCGVSLKKPTSSIERYKKHATIEGIKRIHITDCAHAHKFLSDKPSLTRTLKSFVIRIYGPYPLNPIQIREFISTAPACFEELGLIMDKASWSTMQLDQPNMISGLLHNHRTSLKILALNVPWKNAMIQEIANTCHRITHLSLEFGWVFARPYRRGEFDDERELPELIERSKILSRFHKVKHLNMIFQPPIGMNPDKFNSTDKDRYRIIVQGCIEVFYNNGFRPLEISVSPRKWKYFLHEKLPPTRIFRVLYKGESSLVEQMKSAQDWTSFGGDRWVQDSVERVIGRY